MYDLVIRGGTVVDGTGAAPLEMDVAAGTAGSSRADLNVNDLEALRLHAPRAVHDLPAGGLRILQDATGYRATVVAGEITRRDGAYTGARPGRLLRR